MATASNSVRLVRLNTSDLDEVNPLLTDEDIGLFLEASNGSVNRATAKSLRAIAASEVLVGKRIQTQDLSTDGAAVSAELRALAKEYDAAAESEEAEAEGAFHISAFRPNTARRRHEAEGYRVV